MGTPPEVRGDGEVQLGWIRVREIVEAERGLVTEDASRPVASVTRPEPPDHQVRALGFREECQSVNSAVLANPVTRSDVVDPLVARVPEGGRLLRSEIAALRFGELVEFFLAFAGRSSRVHKRSTFWTYYAPDGGSTQMPSASRPRAATPVRRSMVNSRYRLGHPRGVWLLKRHAGTNTRIEKLGERFSLGC